MEVTVTTEGPLLERERARWRRFLGADLPERRLELRLDLGADGPCTERAALTRRRLLDLRRGCAEQPGLCLERMLASARALSGCRMPTRRHHESAELLARQLYAEAIRQVDAMAAERGGTPEDEHRRACIETLSQATAALVRGYARIFASDYALNRFWYAKVRGRVHRAAARVLELIKLNHRIAALRYAPLPSEQWRIANTLYIVMRTYEPTDLPHTTLAGELSAGERFRSVSLDQLYALLHTYRVLDYSAWPERNQRYIDRYCLSVDQGIVIREPSSAAAGARDTLTAGCYQDGPPGRLPAPEDTGPSVVIDYRVLAQSIRDDYLELTRARSERNRFALPVRLGAVEPTQQTAVGYLLQRNLRTRWHWDEAERAVARRRDLRLYTGYADVRAHLLALFASDSRRREARELADLFAHRSAFFGDDESATDHSLWYVIEETPQRLRIRTQETRFTHPMFIGNLCAYGFGAAEVQRPRLGKVTRFYRPQPGTLLIDIELLAEYAAPVTVYKRDPSQPVTDRGRLKVLGSPMPSLLIQHAQRRWGLITPPQRRFWERTAIGIRCERDQLHIGALGEAEDVTAEFILFCLDAEVLGDYEASYPRQSEEIEVEQSEDD
jgi:hypothetical protein